MKEGLLIFGFISTFAFLLFIVMTIVFVGMACFSIPKYGYMDYFVLSFICLVIALIFIAYFIYLILYHRRNYGTSNGAYFIGTFAVLSIIGSFYCVEKGVSAIPPVIMSGILFSIGVIVVVFLVLLFSVYNE